VKKLSYRKNVLRPFGAVLALMIIAVLAMPAGAAPPAQTPEQLAVGPVSTLAIDNVGGGWGWTGPANPQDNGHLLRLENGVWRDFPKNDPAAGDLGRTAAAVDRIALTGDGRTGWAVGTGGGARVWRYANGTWQAAQSPFDRDTVWSDMSVTADGTDGWLVASDRSLRYQVARLRNGQWVRDYQPVSGEMRVISISPDGTGGWGVGPSRNDPSKYIAVRMQRGRWVENSGAAFEVPYNSYTVTADNSGKGWALGPGVDNRLMRLTPDGAKQVLPNVSSERPDPLPGLHLDTVEVNGFGRGWVTGGILRSDGPFARAPVAEPVLLRIDGDTYTRVVSFNSVPPTPVGTPTNSLLPLAISPDGAHSWLGVSSGLSGFVALSELWEPWPHSTPAAAAPLVGAGHCFAEVPYCLRGVFAAYWDTHGGLDSLGYPITTEVKENINGTEYTVQYTQRARMEYHPENQPPHDVLLGLLGNTLVEPRLNEVPFRPTPPINQPGYQYFGVTQHNVGPPFLQYWNANGGLPVFGLPRSEGFQESNKTDQHSYLVQYFERNRIEYHPENRATRYEYLLGLLGVEQFEATYGYTP
jgi:hypothetical protein